MCRAFVIGVLLIAGCRDRDQERACRDTYEQFMHVPEFHEKYERCVRERWSDRKMECMLRSNGSFLGMFNTCSD